MKTLILMRHAKAVHADGLLSDFERNLNDRGKEDAAQMGKRLLHKKVNPDLIICSAAKRTAKTAKIVADQLGYHEHNINKEFDLYKWIGSFARLDGKTVRMQDAFFLISSRECARPPLLPQTE